MILDSFKPGKRDSLIAELQRVVTDVEMELAQYERVLQSDLDPSQRENLTLLRDRRAKTYTLYKTRLDAMRGAVYHNEPSVMNQKIRRVA